MPKAVLTPDRLSGRSLRSLSPMKGHSHERISSTSGSINKGTTAPSCFDGAWKCMAPWHDLNERPSGSWPCVFSLNINRLCHPLLAANPRLYSVTPVFCCVLLAASRREHISLHCTDCNLQSRAGITIRTPQAVP